MSRISIQRKAVSGVAVLGLMAGALGILIFDRDERQSSSGSERSSGHPRLVSLQPLPEMHGQMCQWMPASAGSPLSLAQARQPSAAGTPNDAARAEAAKRLPIRTLRDSYAAYSAEAVDPARNEVVMTDENLYQILAYDRRTNTPPTATMSEPKRMIAGMHTVRESF